MSKAVVVAVGVHEDGHREVLAMAVGPAETYAFWMSFLKDLVRRGLSGVRLDLGEG